MNILRVDGSSMDPRDWGVTLTHCMLFIKAITHNKVTILDVSNRVPHGPFTNLNQFDSTHPYNQYITKKATKPGDIGLRFKPNLNTVRTARKQFQKSCPNCLKIVPKIQPRLSKTSPEIQPGMSENSLKNC